jgi:putative Holliday junction resolvase
MPATPDPNSSILALDVGDKRVGVARASLIARLPSPLTTLLRGADFFEQLHKIIDSEQVVALVIGLPRSLDGQETNQTKATRTFVAELHLQTDLPVHLQDEALTSQKASEELEAAGRPYQRGDIDALAAAYILEDFLAQHTKVAEVGSA